MKKKTILQQNKTCPVCARAFSNRKSWESRSQWEQVVYCSEKCRRARHSISER
ncbi:DUF2256 domain-containing protein [bacterium]|nr:DUF2256 domain-containing protein [bacterium]